MDWGPTLIFAENSIDGIKWKRHWTHHIPRSSPWLATWPWAPFLLDLFLNRGWCHWSRLPPAVVRFQLGPCVCKRHKDVRGYKGGCDVVQVACGRQVLSVLVWIDGWRESPIILWFLVSWDLSWGQVRCLKGGLHICSYLDLCEEPRSEVVHTPCLWNRGSDTKHRQTHLTGIVIQTSSIPRAGCDLDRCPSPAALPSFPLPPCLPHFLIFVMNSQGWGFILRTSVFQKVISNGLLMGRIIRAAVANCHCILTKFEKQILNIHTQCLQGCSKTGRITLPLALKSMSLLSTKQCSSVNQES